MSIRKISEFEYHTPETIEEAIQLLAEYGKDAKLIAGGTDLIPKMKAEVVVPKHLISVKGIKELAYIKFEQEKGLSFGSNISIKRVEDYEPVKKYYSALYEGAHNIASTQIRNMGTLVGNICNAVPSADSAPGMLVLDAVVHTESVDGKRDIPIGEFFTGVCKTVVKPNEIVVGITFPMPAENSKSMYIAHTVRRALDLAMVGSAAALTMRDGICTDVKIALGAVAIIPKRAFNAEAVLKGNRITDELIEKAALIASEEDCAPITDLRATKEYRKEIVKVITRDAIKACL